MDLYLTSAEPGLTLQEMIDCDIKCGIDFDDGMVPMDDVSAHSHDLDSLDISGMSGLEGELDLKSIEPLFAPLEKLEDGTGEPVEESQASDVTTVDSWMNLSSMNNFNLDIEHGVMVNPSAVLPSTLHGGVSGRALANGLSLSGSISSIERHISSTSVTSCRSISSVSATNSSTNILSSSGAKGTAGNQSDKPKQQFTTSDAGVQSIQTDNVSTRVVLHPVSTSAVSTHSISLPTKCSVQSTTTHVTNTALSRGGSTAPIFTIPGGQTTVSQHNSSVNSSSSPSAFGGSGPGPILTTGTGSSAIQRGIATVYHQNRTNSSVAQVNRGKPLPKYKRERTPDERSFPKPAYSYSCLIALALKNSMTGSLPVSEIYNFMCEHFPYFRTAPNGWKNSVRHNLSLNKCFEKIEKPVVSGSNQRKGCLWALNPAKMHKMDEEVQKWSKKDLQGIKDAMTNPEILENLERGEMKFEGTSSGASSCSEDEDEDDIEILTAAATTTTTTSEAQTNMDSHPVKILNSLNGPLIVPPNKTLIRVHQPNGVRTINQLSAKAIITQGSQGQKHLTTSGTTALQSKLCPPDNFAQQLLLRSAQQATIISSTEEPEYILPDSTMSEINIQSNGALVDDFGNEIELDGEIGVLNPSSHSANSLLLRKVSSSPLRQSSIRSNFVYTSSSPHQNGLGRLVLANTKMS